MSFRRLDLSELSAETAQLSPEDGDTLQLEAGAGVGGVLASGSESELSYNKIGLDAGRMEPKRERNRDQSLLPRISQSLSMARELSHLLYQTMVSDSHSSVLVATTQKFLRCFKHTVLSTSEIPIQRTRRNLTEPQKFADT